MRGIPKFVWEEVHGRNGDGEELSYWQLIDQSGRVLCYIDIPRQDERAYHCDIKIWSCADRDYLDIVHAKRYCEDQASKALDHERIKSSKAKKPRRK